MLAVLVAAAVIVPITLTVDDDKRTGESGQASTENDTGDTPSIPKEKRTPRPKDRDLAAVTEALRQLDPCQLLDLEMAKRTVPAAATIPIGPHACFLAPDADIQPGVDGSGIELKVGAVSDHSLRYSGTPATLGGAKAYQYARQSGSASGSACRMVIPVSFVRAIELSYEVREKDDLCPTVRQYAEAAIAKLQDPDAVAYRDTARPFSAWDGCSLLGKLIGETASDYTYRPDGLKDPFGGCRATPPSNGTSGTPDPGPSIAIRYDRPVELTGENRQIGGKTVWLSSNGERCQATWDNGPSGNQNTWFAATVVELYGTDCDTAAAMAAQAITLAAQPPDTPDAEPQRPLLFGPDDNDTGSVGACVNFGALGGQEDCEPYQEVPVPTDPDDIMEASQANRHMQCAVFKQAIAARFGKEFTPVAWGEHCFFVDEAHTVEILVNVDPVNVASDYGDRPDLYADREEIEIAGKAAVTFWDNDKTTVDIYLSPDDDIDRPGNLHIAVQMIGGRGLEHDDTPTLPQATADQATEVLTEVVEQYFR